MTKKHFVKFAANIKFDVDTANGSQSMVAREGLLTLAKGKAEMICAIASADNARFDKVRFLAACGL